MFIMQDAQLSHDLTLLSSYSTSLLTVMSSGLLASHFQRMASQCRSLFFILLGNRFAVACGVCVCVVVVLWLFCMCAWKQVFVWIQIYGTQRWNESYSQVKGVLLFFKYCLVYLSSQVEKAEVLYTTVHDVLHFVSFSWKLSYLKVISLEKGRVFAATNWGGGATKAQLYQRQKYYEKLFCFGHNFCFLCFDCFLIAVNLFLLW